MTVFENVSRKCEVIFDVEAKSVELAELEEQALSPTFWEDQNAARKVISSTNALKMVLVPYRDIDTALEEVELLLQLGAEETREHQRESAFAEANDTLTAAEARFEKVELQSLLSGPLDSSNAILTLNAGAGGTESCDWADMLFRMYRGFCDTHGYDFEILEYSAGDEAGIKSVMMSVSGPFAYGYLKAERGVHRLVRISPFDSQSRRHTSFSALDVVAEVEDDVEVDIKESDCRYDYFRASGAGGQHVNTTDSAVRITHLPTGIVVSVQAERSQHKNRAKAEKVLRAKVYEWELDQKRKDMEKFYSAKGEIAWGSQIRSYVMQPYTMVKDHRTKVETSNVAAVMGGALDAFIEAQLKNDKAKTEAST